jgi:hypothetical protein
MLHRNGTTAATQETLRRVRLGDLKRLSRARYGHELPDDDAGRETLEDMLCLSADKHLANVIEIWAPWLAPDEAEALTAYVKSLPPDIRNESPKALGQRHRVTNAERERLKVWQFAPCDVTKEQLAEHRKAKERERSRARRRARGSAPRHVYVATSLSRTRPWLAEGISRRTWERHRRRVTQARPHSSKTVRQVRPKCLGKR